MRFSFLKIVFIIFFASAAALLVNYLQPEGLPLINENKIQAAGPDEKVSSPPAADVSGENSSDTIKQDFNKIAVEKNKVKVDEDMLPEYKYKSDSDLASKDDVQLPDAGHKDDDGVNLSVLTKDVFNQPRLISLAQAYELYRNKILFIDARDSAEFEDGHISGAINLPYFSIDEYIGRLDKIDKSDPVVAYCEGADCDMSIRLGNELFARGYKKVFVFFGGWEEWEKAKYPVVTSDVNIQFN